MYQEKTIIFTQFIAAMLMGWDYFISKNLREKIDGFVKSAIEKAKFDLKAHFVIGLEILLSQSKWAFQSILAFLSAFAIFYSFQAYEGVFKVEIAIASGILVSFFIIIGAILSLKFVSIFIVLLGSRGIALMVFRFLFRSDKGPIAFIGFIVLISSFYMRYANAVAT